MTGRRTRRGPVPHLRRPWVRLGLMARINAVASRVFSFGVRREVRRLPEVLLEGETVEMLATGSYGRGNGLLAMTDQRLVFYSHGVLSQKVEDFPYSRISSVQWSGGLLMGTLSVIASGDRTEIGQVPREQGKALADLLGQRLSATAAGRSEVRPAPVLGSADHIAARLGTLDQLRAAGAITDHEYRDRRNTILHSL
ncbi:PH domain-containing protein [Streptomyces sp. NPDC098781]|uniref:PH domain-containing protein n=1 Tax=Streptomyces sp. NPDC098781 TaxID=3366097 RepID=UPI00380F5E76